VGWIQQHYEIVTIAIAAAGLVLGWFQLRKKESSGTTSSVNHSAVNHSPIISGSHNQINIAPGSSTPKQAELPQAQRVVPNFVYAGARQKDVFVSPWPRDGICDPCTEDQRKKAINALVLKFENRIATTDRKIARALNVIAKMRFHHKNGVRQRDVDYGVWLNSPCNSTDIGIGDTRELVLMCVLEKGLGTFEDKRTDNRDFYSEAFSYIEFTDIEGYDRVDIVLIDQNTQASISQKLRFWREGGDFCTSEP
jgi:hypothetical protein